MTRPVDPVTENKDASAAKPAVNPRNFLAELKRRKVYRIAVAAENLTLSLKPFQLVFAQRTSRYELAEFGMGSLAQAARFA